MENYLTIVSHDAFRHGGGLNKAAGDIYWLILNDPMSAAELVRRTGRSRATVYRALRRMSGLVDGTTGEVVSLVERTGSRWSAAGAVDLDRVARIIGTAGRGRRKAEQIRRERRTYRKWLARHKSGEDSPRC